VQQGIKNYFKFPIFVPNYHRFWSKIMSITRRPLFVVHTGDSWILISGFKILNFSSFFTYFANFSILLSTFWDSETLQSVEEDVCAIGLYAF